jgi:uncharacterized protein (DUF924 family)
MMEEMGNILMSMSILAQTGGASATAPEAAALVRFWREAGPALWFAKDPAFDRRFREAFATQYERAARGELDDWLGSADGALALVLLLDQYPRNSFRGTPRMYATDELARHHARRAVELGYDHRVDVAMQFFFYLPFGHSESLLDQERSLALGERFGPEMMKPAIEHADIVRRFGRFPHRNAILGRPSTAAERAYLESGGFAG